MVTDPIVWNRDHGRSKIHDGLREGEVKKPATAPPIIEKPPVDSFEKTSTPAETDDTAVAEKAGGLKISYHFDLFYELSQKVSAKMGQKGLNRFTEVSATVAETFKGSFNLSIDAVGSFLNGTDKSLSISSETAGRFMDSVEGLADLSPNALENFLREADRFFSDLESTYGEADGAFDDIRDQMKSQASQFFDDVSQIREDAVAEAETPVPPSTSTPELPQSSESPEAMSMPSTNPLGFVPLADGSGMELPAKDYQSFVSNFLKYVDQFRKNLVKDFLGPIMRPGTLGKAADKITTLIKEAGPGEKPGVTTTPGAEEQPSLASPAAENGSSS